MIYARVYNKIPGLAIHKKARWSLGAISQEKIKNVEPIGVVIVRFRHLNIWMAFGKWILIHANKFMLVPISKAEYDTDIAFGLWPKLSLIRYPNWIWKIKECDWKYHFFDVHLLFGVGLFIGFVMSIIALLVYL